MTCDFAEILGRQETVYPANFFNVGPEEQTVPVFMGQFGGFIDFTIPQGEPGTRRACSFFARGGEIVAYREAVAPPEPTRWQRVIAWVKQFRLDRPHQEGYRTHSGR